jgi:hypothetical protein
MPAQLRIARPVTDMVSAVTMYRLGLGLEVIGSFDDHERFDGTMLGARGENFHFEFTVSREHPLRPSPTQEDLLVFYVPEKHEWEMRCSSLLAAGFKEVRSFNPYWARNGRTFEDQDGYRLVIQRATWSNENGSEQH